MSFDQSRNAKLGKCAVGTCRPRFRTGDHLCGDSEAEKKPWKGRDHRTEMAGGLSSIIHQVQIDEACAPRTRRCKL